MKIYVVICMLLLIFNDGYSYGAEPVSVDMTDCKFKSVLGFYVAQQNWEVRATFDSNGFDPSLSLVPIYGYWCGPGYPNPGKKHKPFDDLDAACKAHDQCYSRSGYSSCECDRKLIIKIRELRREGKSQVRCKSSGHWTKVENPFYIYVEQYFLKSMREHQCSVLLTGN